MTELLQTLFRGLGNGSLYALLAISFVIIYKSTKVISFAQPALMVAGGVLVSYLVSDLTFYLALPLAAVGIALLALAIERIAIRPMIGKPVFVIAIITLGIDIVVRVVINAFIGSDVRQVGDPWGLASTQILGVPVEERYLAMLTVLVVVVTALFFFFKYSRIGLAMRATSFDQETALAQGISVGNVFALSWAMAGGIAAVAGTFIGIGGGLTQTTWILALKALPAVILGGLDSISGAVLGGLIVGVVESFVASYQSEVAPWLGDNFAPVSPYVVLLIVLLIRPYGLLGTRDVERV